MNSTSQPRESLKNNCIHSLAADNKLSYLCWEVIANVDRKMPHNAVHYDIIILEQQAGIRGGVQARMKGGALIPGVVVLHDTLGII